MAIFGSLSEIQQGCVCDKRAQLLGRLEVKGEASSGPRDTEQDLERDAPGSCDKRGRRGRGGGCSQAVLSCSPLEGHRNCLWDTPRHCDSPSSIEHSSDPPIVGEVLKTQGERDC